MKLPHLNEIIQLDPYSYQIEMNGMKKKINKNNTNLSKGEYENHFFG